MRSWRGRRSRTWPRGALWRWGEPANEADSKSALSRVENVKDNTQRAVDRALGMANKRGGGAGGGEGGLERGQRGEAEG